MTNVMMPVIDEMRESQYMNYRLGYKVSHKVTHNS